MNFAKQLLIIAGLGVVTASIGCGGGGDVIPLAKVEPPKDQGEVKTPKKPSGVMGSPDTPVYK